MMNDMPSGLKRTTQEAVEIKLWEIYLLNDRNNLYSLLSTYALDKGPRQRQEGNRDRVVFRFMKYDWDRTVEALLARHSIPFEIAGTFQTDVCQQMAKKKVYVAEDDLNILFALDIMLEDAGYDVLLSHCGSPMMETNLPAADLFILDNRMPDVNGIDVCRHLKSQSTTQHIPVIMISAVSHVKPQAVRAGVDDFLEKPFQMPELLRLVSKHIAGSKQLGVSYARH
jgi:CheY-like chemotaxis protein